MRRPPRRRTRAVAVAAVALLATVALAACVADPPATSLTDDVEVPSTIFVNRPLGRFKRAMVRFRVQQCGGVAIGSGFAIDAHHVLTNRHVVAAASVIEAETWDGRPLKVTKARVSPDHDLAIVTTRDTLTDTVKLAPDDPSGHTPVVVVGYPLAKELRITSGTVLELLQDPEDYGESTVILTNAAVNHGNSGGPMLGPLDTVVGVVFALQLGTKYGIAIPASTVHQVMEEDDFVANYTCDNVPSFVF